MVLALLPVQGFLGTGATFEADINLVVQAVMAAALVAGAILARQKRYRAHGICQTAVLLLNLLMIGLVMWPALWRMKPTLPRVLHKGMYALPASHALLGMTAELLGLYIILVARTSIFPARLRFTNWKRWMRAELVLWLVVVASGVGTYYAWYMAPFR
ncbi:MAG TPA: DUF420 domain-containing protein [Terriglobales bacterium]|jgi:uncharacterized membrane protein YozB (DUF420 family)|nr:DUF420 domain-containing protein [Terriglobales bacterium]